MNYFTVFAYDKYYPCGGIYDLRLTCTDIVEATVEARRLKDLYDYVNLFKFEEGQFINIGF